MKRLTFGILAALALTGGAAVNDKLYVQMRYPGSTVDSMTGRILNTVEYVVRSTPGIDGTRTTIRPDRLYVEASLRPSGYDRHTVHLDLEHRLDAMRADLPAGITEIFVTDPGEREYPIIVSLSGKGTSMHELKIGAIDLRAKLLRFPEVSDAFMLGEEDESVYLSLPKDKFLLTCGLPDLSNMLAGTLELEPAGALDVGSRHLNVRSPAESRTADDILDMPFSILSPEKNKPVTVMLRDHVSVSFERSFTPPETMTGVDGERCILIAVSLIPGAGADAVCAALDQIAKQVPLGFDIAHVHNLRADRSAKPITFELKAREGTRIESTDEAARTFAKAVATAPGVSRALTVAGGTDIPLVPYQEPRPYTPNRAILVVEPEAGVSPADINRLVARIAARQSYGLAVWPTDTEANGFGTRVERSVYAEDPVELEKLVATLTEKTLATPGVTFAINDWGERVESLRYKLYDSRARQLGITYTDISRACRFAIEGRVIASCWDRGDRLPVVLRLDKKDIAGPQDLETMWVYSGFAQRCVPFSQVVQGFESISEPGCRHRENGRYVAHLLAYTNDAVGSEKLKVDWARTITESGKCE